MQQRNWWEEDELVAPGPSQPRPGPASPYGRVVTGGPRLPPPQTAPQAAVDQFQAERAPYQVQREAIGVQRDQVALEQARREQAAGPAAMAAEAERKAASFFIRALGSNRDYESTGVGPRSWVGEQMQGIAPSVLNQLQADIGNSPARQRSDRAQDEFIAATLRQDSGAAIPEPELERQRRIYFPMAGDGQEAIAQARVARRRAIEGLVNSAGRSLSPELRQQYEQWAGPSGSADQPAPPSLNVGDVPQGSRGGASLDTHTQQVAPRGGDSVAVGGVQQSRMEADPRSAGLNAQLARMLHNNASIGEMARYLRDRGLPPQEYMPALNTVAAFRREHPGFRSPSPDFWVPGIDFENVPAATSFWERQHNRVADSAGGAAAIAAGDTVLGGHLDNVVGALGGDSEMTNLVQQASRQRHPVASLAGDVAGGASLYGGGRAIGGALGRTLPAATGTLSRGAMMGDAALGGYVGSGQGGTDLLSGRGALTGALTGAGGGIAGRSAINTIGRAVAPSGGALAPLYAQGVAPTIGQRMGGVVNRVEQGLGSIPIVGGIQRSGRGGAIDEFQRGAFKQALQDIGQELPRNVRPGTGAQAYMQRAFNDEFQGIRSQMRFAPDGGFAGDFGRIGQDVALLPTESQDAFGRFVQNELGSRLRSRGGVLSGNDYVRVASRLDQKARSIRSNPNGDHELAASLEDLSEALDNAAGRQSGQELAQRLTAARSGYRKAVVIELAGARRGGGSAGEFTPTQFDSAVQRIGGGLRSRAYLRGDAPMQDYSQAGLRLGQTVADSGSGERLATMATGVGALGATGAGGALGSPLALAPWLANTMANAPGGRQAVNWAIKPNRNIPGTNIPLNSPRARKYIQNLAPGASVIGPGMIPMLQNRR